MHQLEARLLQTCNSLKNLQTCQAMLCPHLQSNFRSTQLQIKMTQKEDEACADVRRHCHEGWHAFMPHTPLLRPYWESRSHLATIGDLLLYEERIVIPRCMRLGTRKIIHKGHLGISKCRARANTAVWWPGLSKEVYEMVLTCLTRTKVHPEPKETLM